MNTIIDVIQALNKLQMHVLNVFYLITVSDDVVCLKNYWSAHTSNWLIIGL